MRLIEMVLSVPQLDLQALSKFNYCHIYLDSPRYCIRSCKLNSHLSARKMPGKMYIIRKRRHIKIGRNFENCAIFAQQFENRNETAHRNLILSYLHIIY